MESLCRTQTKNVEADSLNAETKKNCTLTVPCFRGIDLLHRSLIFRGLHYVSGFQTSSVLWQPAWLRCRKLGLAQMEIWI